MRSLIAALALSLPACATTPTEAAAPPDDGCNAEAARSLIGRELTAELGADAVRLAGARLGRIIRPGDAVTMDYSPQRLNIHLDANGRIERLACG